MKEANSHGPKTSGRDSHELRVVGIHYNPGPDAQDRLRRLFTLLLKHAAEKGQISPRAEADGFASECEDGHGS